MSRLQLFEWQDQAWLPRVLRDFIAHHLELTFSAPATLPLRDGVADILIPPLDRAATSHIVDSCSGGGGPLVAVLPRLRARAGKPVTARLVGVLAAHRRFGARRCECSASMTPGLRSVAAPSLALTAERV
jgi:hypothetical protein